MRVVTSEGKEKEKRKTGAGVDREAGKNELMMRTSLRCPPLQALHLKQPQAQLDFLPIQLHPLLQPLHPWLREQALLACLTLPLGWTQALQRHLWHVQSVNQLHLHLLTLVSVILLLVNTLTPFKGTLQQRLDLRFRPTQC